VSHHVALGVTPAQFVLREIGLLTSFVTGKLYRFTRQHHRRSWCTRAVQLLRRDSPILSFSGARPTYVVHPCLLGEKLAVNPASIFSSPVAGGDVCVAQGTPAQLSTPVGGWTRQVLAANGSDT
jgi:hypothetical protein